MSATAFYKRQCVLDFVHEVLDLDSDIIRRPLSDSQRLRFAKEIKGKREERERGREGEREREREGEGGRDGEGGRKGERVIIIILLRPKGRSDPHWPH